MIFVLHVHAPDVVIRPEDILHRQHCGQHRVILIVVLVHAVAADRVHVRRVLLDPAPQHVDVVQQRVKFAPIRVIPLLFVAHLAHEESARTLVDGHAAVPRVGQTSEAVKLQNDQAKTALEMLNKGV